MKLELMGDAWPTAEPADDPVLYGHVHLTPSGSFEARSVQTFKLVYTVGRFGIDDTGSIRIVFRVISDFGGFQTRDSSDYNYVTATTNGAAELDVGYHPNGHQRPWFKALTVAVRGGYLKEGDEICITFGDTSGGSPGMRLQTFVEPEFTFKVLADVCAVGHYVPIPNTPTISVVPGPGYVWRAVLPTLRRPGEKFQFGFKCEDRWGNPSDKAAGKFLFRATLPVKNLPDYVEYQRGIKSMCYEDLQVAAPGVLRISVFEAESDELVAESHPLLIAEGRLAGFWGDMHGQSGESVGVTTAREYFDFARERAFLDLTGHQANDFQVNNAFWAHLNELTAEYNQDGRFITLPGYEWSGNTGVGGDRNVYFRTEGRQIRRSSHALLPDKSDIETDSRDAKALFEDLADEDCVVYAHVGGRYADIKFAHDGKLETAMEIHSAWGTFEWLLTDGFKLGHRSGVVCNSDGHKGRPGASYPGASQFGAYGGLTCFLTEELTRDSIFECLRRRHHYGTTGTRLHLDVRAEFADESQLFERDPKVFVNPAQQSVKEVIMGDIVQTASQSATLKVHAIAQAPIERIEIRNGIDVIETIRPYKNTDLGSRIRVIWQGAEYRGRGRKTHWQGRVSFQRASIKRMEKINAWNHERTLDLQSHNTVVWDSITTGNFGGFDVWLQEDVDASLDLISNHCSLDCKLADIGLGDTVVEAGGLERKIRAFRLPEENPHREVKTEIDIPLTAVGDNPLWVCVVTEDGFQAWSSPIYTFRD